MLGRRKQLEAALVQCREAFRLTREYLGPEVLPPVDGWSWYDADCAAARALGEPEIPNERRYGKVAS
jgi:hypothetical protein